ncbi:MAG: ABC transporter ATP-binding protein [Caldilineaceae bacterium]
MSWAVELDAVTKRFEGPGDDAVAAVNEVSLAIGEGEFFALLGPSGCGKTTTLRMIAGFETPTAGQICIQGQPVNHVPAYLRRVNTVFQNYALFPHMSVFANVAFGLEMDKVSKSEIRRRVHDVLALVQLSDLDQRRPKQLSGGQRQRVALARALVKQPQVLLLDEPLGALDLKLRKSMQLELKHIQDRLGITFIYVTHDQEEALTMADRMAVMHAGRIMQVGAPVEIYEHPVNRFVADFIGETNLIEGHITSMMHGEAIVTTAGGVTVRTPCTAANLRLGQSVTVAVRPEKIAITTDPLAADVVGPAIIEEEIYIGTDMRYLMRMTGGLPLAVRVQNGAAANAPAPSAGQQIYVSWPARAAQLLAD